MITFTPAGGEAYSHPASPIHNNEVRNFPHRKGGTVLVIPVKVTRLGPLLSYTTWKVVYNPDMAHVKKEDPKA